MSAETNQGEQSELRRYLGLTTLQCAKAVVVEDPKIQRVNFRKYFNIPEKPTEEDEELIGLDRQAFLSGNVLTRLIRDYPEGWNISFDSRVEDANGNAFQLPLMDLALRKSEENLDRTKERLKKLIVPRFGGGFILETKDSYHFFGKRLLSHGEWLKFLGFSLLTSIVTVTPEDQGNIHELISDYRYIGHSLIRGSTGLRITANGSKSVLPKVVAII